MVAFYTYFVSCNDTATIRDVVGKCSKRSFLSLIESVLGFRPQTSLNLCFVVVSPAVAGSNLISRSVCPLIYI